MEPCMRHQKSQDNSNGLIQWMVTGCQYSPIGDQHEVVVALR